MPLEGAAVPCSHFQRASRRVYTLSSGCRIPPADVGTNEFEFIMLKGEILFLLLRNLFLSYFSVHMCAVSCLHTLIVI